MKASKKWIVGATSAALVASAIVPVASAASFSDIENSDHKDAILALAEAGIISGYTDGTFRPNAIVTRGNVTKLLGKWLVSEGYEIPADYNTVERFTDLPVTSADQELVQYAALVKDAGVFKGSNDKLMHTNNMTREQMAVVLVRALNTVYGVDLVADYKAANFESKITDLDYATADENREAIIALEYAELTTVTAFNPKNSLTRGQFASFLNRAITNVAKEEVKVESVSAVNGTLTVKLAEAAKEVSVEDFKVSQTINGGTVTEVTPSAAVLSEDGLTVTLTVDKVAAKETTEQSVVYTVNEVAAPAFVVEATTLAVESVTAINATQVKIVFSKKVDETTAETHANYTFTSLDGVTASTAQTAELLDDEKTVIVTVDKPLSKRYQVKIVNVKDADNANATVSYDEVLTFVADTTAPTITGTERISANKVKIKFSEPVTGTASNITAKYADGTAISNLGSLAITAKDELIVDMSHADVLVGKDIVITFNGVTDTNGNLLDPQPATVTVKKEAVDGVAPEISSITQSGAKEFTIKFNKDLADLEFTADKTEIEVSNNTVTAITKISASEYKVTVSTNLDGLQTVTVKANKAVDLAGQANTTDLTKLATFTADTTAPKATSKLVVGKDNKEYVELTFDKDVVVGDVTLNGSYVKDYVTTEVTSVTATAKYADGTGTNKKVVLVPLTDTKLAVEGAVYNLKITSTAVKSLSGVAMSETAATFTRGEDGEESESNTDVVTNVQVAQGTTPDTVTVTFTIPSGQKLDGATATNIANYTIAGAEVESVTLAAASGTTQVATLTLKEDSNTFTGVRNITVKNVKISGSTKVMEPVTINNVELAENVRPTLVGAAITANNKITLTFSEAMTVEQTGAFLVKAGTSTIATSAGASVDSDSTKVIITLDSPLTSAELSQVITVEPAKLNGEVDTTNFKVKDAKGNYLKAFAPITVVKP